MAQPDVIVCGAGLVGSALALGLARVGRRVLLLDGDDALPRASRGNFGLVWMHGKGLGLPQYARWTQESVRLYPEFARELEAASGVATGYRRCGGFWLTLDAAEFAEHQRLIEALQRQSAGEPYPAQIVDRATIARTLPCIGPDVPGGSYSDQNGEVNPLALLRALHVAAGLAGVRSVARCTVESVERRGGGYRLTAGDRTFEAEKLVLAAGLGSRRLGALLGIDVPVAPSRGHLLVTERVPPMFPVTTNVVRQLPEGTLLLGATVEDVGMNDRTHRAGLQAIARIGVKAFPVLRRLSVVRSWAALRVMTRDGYPVYEQASGHPNLYVTTVHSGVTLAAVHMLQLAPWIAGGDKPAGLDVFTSDRFRVQAAA